MAKNVFRSNEIKVNDEKVVIEPPVFEEPEPEEVEEVEEYTGPTADDLRREAEAFQAGWEKEKARMVEEAQQQAEAIVEDARQQAFDEVKRKNDQAAATKREAEEEARRIENEARQKAEGIVAEAEEKAEGIRQDAYSEGYEEGRKEGYSSGEQEVQRLVERLQVILSKVIEKRGRIIDESETQLVNLVLLIAKKVVKVISENQKNVVINNVIQALRKMKTRGDVVIRVNLADLKLTTEHTKDFMQMVEKVKSVTVMEDSTVDKGGCIVETDFGEIDARISSQLHEIEEKILEQQPITTNTGAGSGTGTGTG
ncbi:MAG: flagellar assembly protein FliH [Spirochaetales bacterium]|nr:flagellar assembly protein FliH [Spirochaetales bacterium]MCF7937615.1 flagellar assembly protein FliH [Spirochaetales bacterium]